MPPPSAGANRDSTLSSYNPVVGRKKSTRWVVRNEREDADYDEYDWTESEDDEPPPLPEMPTDIPQLPLANTNNNSSPFSSGLNNNSSSSFSSQNSNAQDNSFSSSKTNFHVASYTHNTPPHTAPQLSVKPAEATPHPEDNSAYGLKQASPTTLPSLTLPSLTKRLQATSSSSPTNNSNGFSDDEDDAFRESTNSFYSAAEQPSTEDLRAAYSNTFTKNLQPTQKQPFTSKNALSGFGPRANTFQPEQPLSKPLTTSQSRVTVIPSQQNPSLSPSTSNDRPSQTLNRTISRRPVDLSNTISHETPAKFDAGSATQPFKQNLNTATSASSASELNSSDFNSTITASSPHKNTQSYSDDENEAASVDDIAKSIAEEFASPSFTQGILPSSSHPTADLQKSKSPSTTSLNQPPTSKTSNATDNFSASDQPLPSISTTAPAEIPESSPLSHPQTEHNKPLKLTLNDSNESPETDNFQPQRKDIDSSTSNTHKRDFSISSYLDDYYDNDKESTPLPELSSHDDNVSKDATVSQPLPKSSIHTTSRNFSSSTVESSTTIDTLTKPDDNSDDGSIEEIGFSTRSEAKETSQGDSSFLENIEDYSGEIKSANRINTWSDHPARSPQFHEESHFSNETSPSSTPTINDNKSPSLPQTEPIHQVSRQISNPALNTNKEHKATVSPPVSHDDSFVRTSTPEPHANGFDSADSFDTSGSPLPMPASRFHIPGGRFSSASDSMRSFAGNETDDSASLSTGRKSPQSFSYSFRDSYDFRSAGLVPGATSSDVNSSPSASNNNSQNNSFTPDPSEGAPTFDQIKNEIPGPTSPISKVGRWKPLDFSTEPSNSSSPMSANSTSSSKAENREISFNDKSPAPNSTEETFASSNTTQLSYNTQKTTDSSKSDDDTSSSPNKENQQDVFGTYSVPKLNTENLDQSSDEANETPVTAEQNALERQIMSSFSGSSSHIIPSDTPGSPDISQQTPKYSSETPSGPAYNTQLKTPALSYNDGLTPQVTQSPVSPTEPDPIVAELYRDSSKILSRPISQLITTGIPQTQPLNSLNKSISSSSENDKESALAPAFDYNDKKESDQPADKTDTQEQSSISYSAPPIPKMTFNSDGLKPEPSGESQSRSPSRSTLGSSPNEDDRSSLKSYNQSSHAPSTHSRSNSFAVKSLIVDSPPTLSPVQSLKQTNRVISGERFANRRSSSLIINDPISSSPKPIGRQQSLASLLNRPPVLDFQGILTRPRSVDRKAAFDLARQAQADYDSGLQTWLLQVSSSMDMKSISKSSAPIPQAQKSSGVLGTTGSIAANKVKHFAANSIQPRKLSSALSEVSNKTHGLADKLHISGIGEKSSSAFSRLKFGIKKPKS